MYNCIACNKAFKSTRTLKNHLKSEGHEFRIKNPQLLLLCICGRSFQYKQGLSRHKRECSVVLQEKETKKCKLRDENKQLQQKPDTMMTETNVMNNNKTQNIQINAIGYENLDHITDLEETATIACLRAKISSLEKKLEETKIHTTIVQQGRRRINKQVRQTIATNQDHKCNDCKTTLTAYFQIDHLIGLQYGGTDEIDNLQALCGDCHTKKSIIENRVRNKIRHAIRKIITEEETAMGIVQT